LNVLDGELIKVANFIGGEEAVRVVETLKKIGEASDDKIATESGVRLNSARKILYKLYDHALVSCSRFRDEKSGWYIFYWKLQQDQLDAFIRGRIRRCLNKLKSRLEYERSHSFFVCRKCPSVRLPFEEAVESAFCCTSCGEQLINLDNSKIVENLSIIITKLEEGLK